MKIRNILLPTLAVALLIGAGSTLADERDVSRDERLRRTEEAYLAEMSEAREYLNQERFESAARKYAEVFEHLKHRSEAGNALYWEAFARYRLEKTRELKHAVELLRRQQEHYVDAETARDGQALLARIQAELAQRGDPESARDVEEGAGNDAAREETRIYALHALAEMDADRALPILEKIVLGQTPGSDDFRRNAVFVLCRIDDPRSEDLLIELVHTVKDREMLVEVINCLSMLESDRALDVLIDLFRTEKDSQVGEVALFAIGRSGDVRAFDLLAEIVRDRSADPEMRQQALLGLRHSDRGDDVAALATEILRSKDESREMQEMALMALASGDSDVAADVFQTLINNRDADDELRSQALFFAAQRDDLSIDFLRRVYEQADGRDLRLQVCHILTQVDDESAALDLLLEIARTEKDPEIRQNVVFWIGRFDDDRAAEYLLRIINEK